MSRTFKDMPEWVRAHTDRKHSHVEHHHDDGVCHVETLEEARRFATSFPSFANDHDCPARERVWVSCGGKVETFTVLADDGYSMGHVKRILCGYSTTFKFCDRLHAQIRSTGIRCDVCDDVTAARFACRRVLDDDVPYWRRYRPRRGRELVSRAIERPNRQRVRRQLRDAVDEWNSFGSTDVDPEPAYTSGASWLFC